ncbi:hypothetical protein SUDANB126_06414 [Streptomyces sp. enrichment culture]
MAARPSRMASPGACLLDGLISRSDAPVRLVITDAMRGRIEPLMPADPVRGRRWADHRPTLEAIAWKYRTDSPWRDLPDEPGSHQTAHERLIRRAVDGTGRRSSPPSGQQGTPTTTSTGRYRWTPRSSGPTSTPPGHAKRAACFGGPAGHALRRSRGGLGTKVHPAADGGARPPAFTVTAGRAGDAPAFETVMARIRVPRRVRAGRGPAPSPCRPIGPTRPAPSAATCDAGESARSSRSPPTRLATGYDEAAKTAARPASTAMPMNSGTPSNDASTASSSGAA